MKKPLSILFSCVFLACTANVVYAKNEASDAPEKKKTITNHRILKAGYNVFADNKEVHGTGNGSYSGGITVTPVPEPETLAMMMAGVCFLSFQFWKRREKFIKS